MEKNNFQNLPIEEDTKIIWEEKSVLGDYEVLHQVWGWDGIWGESIIFQASEVATITDEALQELCEAFIKGGSSTTISRGEHYSFVNGNFA